MRTHLRIAVITLSGVCGFLGGKALGQIRDQGAPPQMSIESISPGNLQLMRYDLQKQKQKLIAEDLPTGESEAIKFRTVCQKYSNELNDVNGDRSSMNHSYTQNWRSMSNDDALIFIRRWLDDLPGKKAATFFQLDERINMMMSCRCSTE